jgi:glycosyltransferase domain-containing protein
MKIKDTLTIIIPVLGRPKFTVRILDHLEHINCPFQILIADGSHGNDGHFVQSIVHIRNNDENWDQLGVPRPWPNLRVDYYQYPPDDSIGHYMHKMKDIYSKVTTPFTIMVDNDDLLCLNGLYEGIEFLCENEEYASYREDVRSVVGALHPHGPVDSHSIYKEPTIKNNTPSERIQESLASRNSAWHDICRTEVHREFFSLLSKMQVQDLQLVISLQCYYPLLFGKAYRNDEKPYYYHLPGWSVVQMNGVLTRMDDWLVKRNDPGSHFDFSMAQAVSIMANALVKYEGMSLAAAKSKFATSFMGVIVAAALENKRVTEDPNFDAEIWTYDSIVPEMAGAFVEKSIEWDEMASDVLGLTPAHLPTRISLDEKLSIPMTHEESHKEISELYIAEREETNNALLEPYVAVLGDSHVRTFSYSVNFLPLFIGTGREANFSTIESAKFTHKRLSENAIRFRRPVPILLVFGEPDIRLYLENEGGIADKETMPEYIIATVDRYMAVVKNLQTEFDNEILIYNAVPRPDVNYNKMAMMYNARLGRLCKEHNIKFVDIWDSIVDENLSLDQSYSADYIHLDKNTLSIINKVMKSHGVLSSTAPEEANYRWDYRYRFTIGEAPEDPSMPMETRIWCDEKELEVEVPDDIRRLAEDDSRPARAKAAALPTITRTDMILARGEGHLQGLWSNMVDDPQRSADGYKKLLLLQCGEGHPVYAIGAEHLEHPIKIHAVDIRRDKIVQANRTAEWTRLDQMIYNPVEFSYLTLPNLARLDTAEYDAVLLTEGENEDLNQTLRTFMHESGIKYWQIL